MREILYKPGLPLVEPHGEAGNSDTGGDACAWRGKMCQRARGQGQRQMQMQGEGDVPMKKPARSLEAGLLRKLYM